MTSRWTIALVLCAAVLVQGEHHRGTGKAKDGFLFLGKMAFDVSKRDFDDRAGEIFLTLEDVGGSPHPDLRVFLYDDEDTQWPAIYGKDLPCSEKVEHSIDCDSHFDDDCGTPVTFTNGVWRMNGGKPTLIHQTSRPRFWYVVAASCRLNPPQPEIRDLKYDVHMVHPETYRHWYREFGVNMQGLNTLYVFYWCVWTVGMVVWGMAVRSLIRTDCFHPIVKLLTVTLGLMYVAIFFEMIHYVRFVNNGTGVPGLHGLAFMLIIASDLTFLLLLMLLAQGWTISTDIIHNRKQLAGGMMAFGITWFILMIWSMAGRDPASNLYLYSSAPGIILVILSALAGCWFGYTCYQSYQREVSDPHKRSLFKVLGIVFTAFFALLPLAVIIAAIVEPWVRQKTVQCIVVVFQTFFFAGLCYVLWPSHAENYFRISVPAVGFGGATFGDGDEESARDEFGQKSDDARLGGTLDYDEL